MIELAPDMKLRISVELRQKIEEAAKRNGRTLNGEINVRLEASFSNDPLEAQLKRLAKRVAAIERRMDSGMPSLAIEDDDPD
jgi:hypothetical protein